MNIRYLKWVLIALLLLVNIYLVFGIYLQYRDLEVVGREEQELVSSLLAEDGIFVSPDVIPDRKPSGDIYEYELLSDSYCERAATRFFGYLAQLRQQQEPKLGTYVYREGVKVIVLPDAAQAALSNVAADPSAAAMESGDGWESDRSQPIPSDGWAESTAKPSSLYFSLGTEDILGFEYRIADGDDRAADYVLALVALFGEVDLFSETLDFSGVIGGKKQDGNAASDGEWPLLDAGGLRITDGRYHRRLTKEAETLLDEAMNGGEKAIFRAETTGVVEDKSSGYITVTLGCRMNGSVVYGAGAVLVYDESEQLIYAGGRLLFDRPGRSYQSALRDQINILFDERSRHHEGDEGQNGPSAGDGDAPDLPQTEYSGDSAVVFPWWYEETEQPEQTLPKPPTYEQPADTSEPAGLDEGKYADDPLAGSTVTKMSVIYCINWNDVQTKCYLIPAWKIDYADGSTYIRNAINGDLHR